ncbi:uncharacterized protein MCYG_06776 [Microsporum canis CBS 113480]|uniref:Uncharacterized protein n=1 Tax=Arthroderma otae (strain ATCC MYA-4605 / CBS 113480) TaxID=554155 RepID=C5FVM3_ARTOC|nr:uncharacterized protein MCYG_06776 [Microsporum canis CBS 113480]EEQ33957.1 predicted protein [Microsporum canis CBS 113480]
MDMDGQSCSHRRGKKRARGERVFSYLIQVEQEGQPCHSLLSSSQTRLKATTKTAARRQASSQRIELCMRRILKRGGVEPRDAGQLGLPSVQHTAEHHVSRDIERHRGGVGWW